MFVFYAFIVSVLFCGADLFYFKLYQLEAYKAKKYLKSLFQGKLLKYDKNQLIFTNRIKRLLIFNFLLKILIFSLIFGFISVFWINFITSIALFLLGGIFVLLSFFAMLPVESIIKKRYIKRAQNRLKEVGCKVVAITGSVGKTSVKNILFDILKEQVDVCCTPKSFNTPMGICRTVLENLKDTDEILIVEYGARRRGDIEFLARTFGADFSIITPIGMCHLESFGTVENIENTKFELCKRTKEVVVFSGKSDSSRRLFERFESKKFLVGQEGTFAFAKNLKWTEKGSQFVLSIDQKEIACKTKLLGRKNVDNIVQAATMAYLLGLDLISIQKGVAKASQIPHRLELIRGENVFVIDDSFNSNFEGFKEALEVLSQFKGKKFVVSPGVVELGKEQFDVNYALGKEIAQVADVFVLMNQTNKKALLDGAIDGGMSREKIYFSNTRAEQKIVLKNLLTKGDAVLFENDLPDNFK